MTPAPSNAAWFVGAAVADACIRLSAIQREHQLGSLRSPGERIESHPHHCRSADSEHAIQLVSPITLGGRDRAAADDNRHDTYLSTIVLADRARSNHEPEAELLDFRPDFRLEAGRRREPWFRHELSLCFGGIAPFDDVSFGLQCGGCH